MRRLVVCLPLCLLLAPQSEGVPRDGAASSEGWGGTRRLVVPAVPSSGHGLPTAEELLGLLRSKRPDDRLAFLGACLRRYDREVKGYRVTLHKHERVGGTPTNLARLRDAEVVDCWFREEPFSVRMHWRKGAGLADRTLYVKGDPSRLWGRVVVRFFGRDRSVVVERDPGGWEVRRSTRYPPAEFGLKMGTRRVLKAWQDAQRRGTLRVRYEGTRRVEELGGRVCWVVRRVGYTSPEDDGVTESVFYFDPGTWLMLGTELKGLGGEFLASYWFRDLHLNPDFPPDTFTRAALEQ